MVVGVGWVFGSQLVALACGLVTGGILARGLGPEGQGLLAIALLIPTFLAISAGGGLNAANVYFAGNGLISTKLLVSNAIAVAAIATLLSAAAVALLWATGFLEDILPGMTLPIAVAGVLLLPLLLLRQSFSAVLLGLQRISHVSLVDVLQSLAYVLAALLLVALLRGGVPGAITAFGVAMTVALGFAALLLRRQGATLIPATTIPTLRRTLGFGLRGSVGMVVQFFTYRLDLLLVNVMLGAAMTGYYAVASRLAELLWLMPAAVGAVIFARSSRGAALEMNRITPQAFWGTTIVGGLVALAMAVAGPLAISTIYSEDFLPAYLPMAILLPGSVLLGASSVLANDLAGRGKPGLVSMSAFVAFALTVILDLALIPPFGLVGAALASTIAYSTYCLGVAFMYLRVTGLSLLAFVGAIGSLAKVRDAR